MSKQPQHWVRLCVLCCLLALGACTSTTFFYNRLDFLLPWYVDDYANLNREQNKFLDQLLTPFLSWHRQEELPRYLVLLDRLEASLEQPVQQEEVAAIVADFQLAWSRVEDESLDWLLALGSELSDEQIDGFLKVMRERQHEYEEKYLERSDEEFVEDSYDRIVDNARDYVGKLSKKQRQQLQLASTELRRSDAVWLQERADWTEQMAVLLQREAGWQERVKLAIADRRQNPSEDFVQIYQYNLAVINRMVSGLLNDLSDKQDQHLQRKLRTLRNDLNTLIAQGQKSKQSNST